MRKKSDLERTELAKEKTGVFTGAYAINPVNGEKIPIWIADYVLISYGTGAIMAVPAHDTRDFEFATKFNLPIVQVVQPPEGTDWQRLRRGRHCGQLSECRDLAERFADPRSQAEDCGLAGSQAGSGKRTINYKLRDWLFSRQRYWGEPFPILWKTGPTGSSTTKPLPESELPLLPPALEDYKPTPDGQPPLARAAGMGRTCRTAQSARPTPCPSGRAVAGITCATSIRRTTAHFAADGRALLDGHRLRASANGRTRVDLYVGGTEHAVLHLLYARFWHKVLFDLGHVSTAEPFYKLVNQGLILGEDGQKMSKSRGNVVNPDDILVEYGADAFRLYEMFMGPLEMTKPWSTKGVEGVYRFLGRVWRLFVDEQSETEFEQNSTAEPDRGAEFLEKIQLSAAIADGRPSPAQLKALHSCIKKVTEDLDGLRFNTAISALMVFVNEAITWETKPASVLRDFLALLQPFSPHLAEELWSKMNLKFGSTPSSLAYIPWPKFDSALLVEDTLEIPVQVNGKLRDVIRVPANATQAELEAAALKAEKAQPFLAGKTVRKIIVVPRKMVNVLVS